MQEQLFTQALGLTPPWAVDGVSFRPDEGAIHFEVSCDAARLACPACGAADQPVHDRVERTWQHLHFFQFKAFIHCRVPRVACRACGKTPQAPVPWAAKGSGFSMLMEAFVVTMCASLPVAHVARLVGVSDDRIWRVLRRHDDTARAKENFAEVRRVGVDETASRKGQRYVTLFHDLDRRRLLFATPGRDKTTFTRFTHDLRAHGGKAGQVTDWCMDLSGAYQAGAKAAAPEAAISFDPFHVVALAHKALDQVRRAEVKSHPELKHSRWGTLKAPRRWNAAQIHTMHWLQRSSLKTARAWRLKEALRRIYETAATVSADALQEARRHPPRPPHGHPAAFRHRPVQRPGRGLQRPDPGRQGPRQGLSHRRQPDRHQLPAVRQAQASTPPSMAACFRSGMSPFHRNRD